MPVNYQQSIIKRRTPPSLDSIAEGQIVFAIDPNKGLRMYTKQSGQLWISSFYKHREGEKLDDLLVRGESTFLKNLTVDGIISGTQIYRKDHSFNYSGTDKVYIGFTKATASTSIDVAKKFIAPYDGRLEKVMVRTEAVAGSTVIGFHKASDTTTDPSGTATEDATVVMSAADTTYEFDFSSDSSDNNTTFNKGDVIAISMDATNAVNDTNITTVWLLDAKI
mgnify:CR=1 FL=1